MRPFYGAQNPDDAFALPHGSTPQVELQHDAAAASLVGLKRVADLLSHRRSHPAVPTHDNGATRTKRYHSQFTMVGLCCRGSTRENKSEAEHECTAALRAAEFG